MAWYYSPFGRFEYGFAFITTFPENGSRWAFPAALLPIKTQDLGVAIEITERAGIIWERWLD
jgi:hypothetical protein